MSTRPTLMAYSAVGEVRLFRFAPGDGWRYEVVVTPLPAELQGGVPGQHVLVTVIGKAGTRSAVFADDGSFLARYYVCEKLNLEPSPVWDNTVASVGCALGRETDAEWSDG